MSVFEGLGLETVESVAFDLVKKLTGLDLDKEISSKKEALREASELTESVSVVLGLAYRALEDNRLSLDEIKAIVAAAKDLPAAAAELAEAFKDDGA